MKPNFLIFIFILGFSLSNFAARSPSSTRFTSNEMRSVLDKTREAIGFGFYAHAETIRHLAKNSKEIYALPANEFTETRDRILVLPSTLITKDKKRVLCVVAQDNTFKRVVDDNSTQAVAENLVLFKDLSAEEKQVLKTELKRAVATKRLPSHCSFARL